MKGKNKREAFFENQEQILLWNLVRRHFLVNGILRHQIYGIGMEKTTSGQMQLRTTTVGNIVSQARVTVMSARELTAVESVSVARRLHGVAKDASGLVVTQARGREH